MIWSIETDDFLGKCGQGKFPLLASIRKGLNGQVIENPPESSTPPTSTPSTSTPSSTTSSTSQTWWPTSSSTQTTWWPTSSTTQSPWWPTSSTPSSTPWWSSSSSTPSSQQPSSSTTSAPGEGTTPNPDTYVCKEEGMFKGNDCATFYQCVFVGEFGKDGSKYRLFVFHCPSGNYFFLLIYLNF